MKINYYALQRSMCQQSYWHFVKTFWHTVSKEKLVANWHMPYLADDAQEACERVIAGEKRPYDTVVNISPGTSKSSLYSIFLLPWVWAKAPHIRFIGASYTESLAYDLSTKSRQILNSPLYKQLFPEVVIRRDTDSKGHWANTLGGDRYAVGVGGAVTGKHAHIIVIDDPLDPRGARSMADIQKASLWVGETIASRKVNKDTAWTGLVMQRLSVEDPTELFLKRPDVKHICLPATTTDYISPPNLHEKYVDGLFDPVRLSLPALKKMEEELGQFGYAGQFMQSPIPLGGGMFRPDCLDIRQFAPDEKDFVKIVRAWDRAASSHKGDYTVGVKMGRHKDGSFWVLDIVRGQWATDEREDTIERYAHRDGRKVRIVIEQEPGSAGVDSAKATIKRLAGFLVTAERATGSKELRADTYSVQVNAGNVRVVDGPYVDAYKAEMVHFPNGRNDDQIDASSLAFSSITLTKPKLGIFK